MSPVAGCNPQLCRRSQVAAVFPDDEPCRRLVAAILMKIAEDRQPARI